MSSLSKFSGIYFSDIATSLSNVSTSHRANILGDGHCCFRSLVLATTGSQWNHKTVHLAMVNFCLLPENVTCLSAQFGLDVGSFDPIAVMPTYIKENTVLTTCLQFLVLQRVNGYITGHYFTILVAWLPATSRPTSITDSSDHYDVVIPQL